MNVETACYWCKVQMRQRSDTYRRQANRYGHSCCKRCFGNEQSFKDARRRVMLTNNPFSGKKHSEETRARLSKQKTGGTSWNAGLTKDDHASIAKFAQRSRERSKANIGSKNPNWKGGKRGLPPGWKTFRKTIIERDCNSCWKCGLQKKIMDVHHMVSKTRHPEYALDERCCIVLCRDCHNEFHIKYSSLKFKSGDTKRWLNDSRAENEKLILC